MDDSSLRPDHALIDGFIGGEVTALRRVDGWIEVVLRRDFRSLAPEWEDVRQEVRTRVFRNLSRDVFRGESDLRTYVHQITRNVCVDQLRGRRKDARLIEAQQIPQPIASPEAARRSIARDLLERLLRGLTSRDRRLLDLVHVEQRSYAEVARELGISEGAVKLRMFRCRRRILKRGGHLLRLREDGQGGRP